MTNNKEVLTVVVVDDEVMILDVMKSILEAHGLTVFSFTCASEAMTYICENSSSIDAVVTDYKMPGKINGYDIYKLIRAKFPSIACFIASGYIEIEEAEVEEQFLTTKPINFDQFLPALYTACGARK